MEFITRSNVKKIGKYDFYRIFVKQLKPTTFSQKIAKNRFFFNIFSSI